MSDQASIHLGGSGCCTNCRAWMESQKEKPKGITDPRLYGKMARMGADDITMPDGQVILAFYEVMLYPIEGDHWNYTLRVFGQNPREYIVHYTWLMENRVRLKP